MDDHSFFFPVSEKKTFWYLLYNWTRKIFWIKVRLVVFLVSKVSLNELFDLLSTAINLMETVIMSMITLNGKKKLDG